MYSYDFDHDSCSVDCDSCTEDTATQTCYDIVCSKCSFCNGCCQLPNIDCMISDRQKRTYLLKSRGIVHCRLMIYHVICIDTAGDASTALSQRTNAEIDADVRIGLLKSFASLHIFFIQNFVLGNFCSVMQMSWLVDY